MIDTNKYEGHLANEGQTWVRSKWRANNNETIEQYEATAALLNDAPLLLAEVKRWRKVYQYIHHLYSSNQKTVPLYELMELIEEEVIE